MKLRAKVTFSKADFALLLGTLTLSLHPISLELPCSPAGRSELECSRFEDKEWGRREQLKGEESWGRSMGSTVNLQFCQG